jgi:hypothetical protein
MILDEAERLNQQILAGMGRFVRWLNPRLPDPQRYARVLTGGLYGFVVCSALYGICTGALWLLQWFSPRI